MLRDKCDGLTRVRNARRSDSPLLACVATRIVARETGPGRDAALLGDGDGTHCRIRAARPSPIDALTRELALRPTTTHSDRAVDHLNNQKLSIRMWRAFLAALWLMPDAYAALAQAQTPAWPSKPVRISVPVTAGSAIDLVCRTVFDQVSQQLGQPFIIDNRGGGGGTLAPAAVAKADPDGYTLLSHSPSLTIFPATHNTLPYDTERDFTGVVALVNTPFLLAVSPEKYKTAGELVAAARAKPGALNYASVGHGGAAHINAERFRLSARIDVQEIPFRGVQEALTELLAGRVDFFFTPVLPAMPLIRDGRILPLAVSSNKRISSLPDLPTLAEAGYPDSDFPFWIGVFAPSKTPRDIQEKLYRETAKALQLKNVQDKLMALGGEPFEMTSSQFDGFFRAQIKQNRELVKAAGIKPH
jgi:tripartite-type tricarboxylate transporter receptor subunit TctC